ncbi:MAG: FAD-dependent oxidoreductase [Actinomycetota bacterium]|nr:FAD-dependent oxidoreductase [Actinomycetota bacterium]
MGATGAAVALGAPAARAATRSGAPTTRHADVVVVGAGIAGLTTARLLRAEGMSVIVVEARSRVGGRTLNQDLAANGYPGRVVEMGGQFAGPLPGEPPVSTVPGQAVYRPQNKIVALARQLGIATFKTYNAGDYVNVADGIRTLYNSSSRLPIDPGTVDAGLAVALLNGLAKQVNPATPWSSPNAEAWDAQTVESWIRTTLVPPSDPGSVTNHLVTLAIEEVLSVEPREISLLWLLTYIANAGSLDNLINTANGAQDSRFVGGSQAISLAMAAELGEDLMLGSPVRALDQRPGGVTVSGVGFTVTGSRAVVALPPALAGRIAYTPTLAAVTPAGFRRDQLTQRWPMASILKVNVIYSHPFWRDAGLAGQVTSDRGAVRATFDNTPYPDSQGADVTPGALLCFVEADEARTWSARSRTERYKQVLSDLAVYFGPQARSPLGGTAGYYEALWNLEEFSGGGPTGFPTPGTLTDYGSALRAPIGLLHWAGTETATRWTGYMDGAVDSAERVAAEVVAALG